MIPCICVDDANRPEIIPTSKWVKRGEQYKVTHFYYHPTQKTQAVCLYEKPLGEECEPYVSFKLSRFAFKEQDIPALIELAKNCSELNELDISELMQELSAEKIQ